MVKRMCLVRDLRRMYGRWLKEKRDRWAEDAYVREEGRTELLTIQICRKMLKEKTPAVIADELEVELSEVDCICKVAIKYMPDYDVKKICEEVLRYTTR